MTESKPMDPESLACARDYAAGVPPRHGAPASRQLVAELLAAYDHVIARVDHAERLLRGDMTPEHKQALDCDHPAGWRDLALMRGAEVTRLRARVQVGAEDLERAGVTRGHVEAWLAAAPGWERIDDGSWPSMSSWLNRETMTSAFPSDDVDWLPNAISAVSDRDRTRAWAILEEMAAMEVEP